MGSGGVGQRKRNYVDMSREFELLVAEFGRKIDLKNEETSLNFIYVTPKQLIGKEGSEQKPTKVDLYTGVAQAKWDLLAAKEDFRLNSQYEAQTGRLGEDLNVDNQYINLMQDHPIPLDPPFPGSPSHDHHYVDASPFPAGPDQSDHDLTHDSVRADAQSISFPTSEFLATAPPITPASLDITTPESVFDPWAQPDPHEQVCIPKPMKKGNITSHQDEGIP